MGAPRWFFEGAYMTKHMGEHYSIHHAYAQAFDCQYIQPVCKAFPGNSPFIPGDPQIVDLEDECEEGMVEFGLGNGCVKGMLGTKGHKQYQMMMTFCQTVVKISCSRLCI